MEKHCLSQCSAQRSAKKPASFSALSKISKVDKINTEERKQANKKTTTHCYKKERGEKGEKEKIREGKLQVMWQHIRQTN